MASAMLTWAVDRGNIVALAGLANQNLLSGQTLASAYSALATNVGSYGQDAKVAAQKPSRFGRFPNVAIGYKRNLANRRSSIRWKANQVCRRR